jgi:hypothetical protein
MIIEAIILTVAIFKGSQAVNHISGGEDTLTLTEQSYQACASGDDIACVEKGIYTVAFFPVDTVATTLTGRPDLIGSSHGKIWHEIDKKLPVISRVKPGYGGKNYHGFMKKKR